MPTRESRSDLATGADGRSSAEDAPEELAEGESQVNNIVYTFRLTSTTFDKKSYMTYLKASPCPAALLAC